MILIIRQPLNRRRQPGHRHSVSFDRRDLRQTLGSRLLQAHGARSSAVHRDLGQGLRQWSPLEGNAGLGLLPPLLALRHATRSCVFIDPLHSSSQQRHCIHFTRHQQHSRHRLRLHVCFHVSRGALRVEGLARERAFTSRASAPEAV